LVNGTGTFKVTLWSAGSWTITATDVTDGTKTANTSSPVTVQSGALETAALTDPKGRRGIPMPLFLAVISRGLLADRGHESVRAVAMQMF